MSRYEDTHVDDGMRHGGLVPSREEKEFERMRQRAERAEAERDSWRRVLERMTEERDALAAELAEATKANTAAYRVADLILAEKRRRDEGG